MAWLHAVPDIEGCTKSRQETFEDEGLVIDLPDCSLIHVIEYLSDIGIALGDRPLTYGEIESWKNITGIEIEPWEGQFMKKISAFYLGELRNAESKDAESIWDGVPREMTSRYRAAMRQKMAIRRMVEDK